MSIDRDTIVTLNSVGDMCVHSIKPKQSCAGLLSEESLLGLQNSTLNEICVDNRLQTKINSNRITIADNKAIIVGKCGTII